MSTTLASGADARYGFWLLNLVGSVKANSDLFDRIVLYDLGLTPFQRRLAEGIRGVELRTVPPFVPHWRQGRTWKLWIWRHLEAEALLWLDAGVTVLRRLDDPLAQIRERGYFAVSTGHPVWESTPSSWYPLLGLDRGLGERTAITTGLFGFRTSGPIFDEVVVPSFDDAVAGRCLGFSAGELGFNQGLDRAEQPLVHDCPLFRWDQSVVNVRFHAAFPDAHVNDVYKYGGWLGRDQHPEQLLWNHRRRGDYAYLPRIPYRAALTPLGKSWGLWFRWRWWAKNHSWLFRPATYGRKARKIVRAAWGR